MKKFIIKILAVFLILVSITILSHRIFTPVTLTNGYLAAIKNKHERINKISGQSLILAGGSNLTFGIDSEYLQNILNMPVTNLSLHGGLGLCFILKELEDVMDSNDVVIICPEYFLSLSGDYEVKKAISTFYPNANKYYKRNLLLETNQLFQDIKKNIARAIVQKGIDTIDLRNNIYSKNMFNTFGDMIGHLSGGGVENINELRGRKILKYEYWKGINKLNQFAQKAYSKKVHIIFLYPCYSNTEYQKNKKAIQKLHADLKQDLKIPILNSAETFVYGDSLFFDTVYHLNSNGRQKRTIKIGKIIQDYLVKY